jgi:hypothetical protein
VEAAFLDLWSTLKTRLNALFIAIILIPLVLPAESVGRRCVPVKASSQSGNRDVSRPELWVRPCLPLVWEAANAHKVPVMLLDFAPAWLVV